MANPQLNWNRADQGVAFRVTREDGGRSTPPSDWQDLGEIELPSRQPARIGPLLRLMEEERAVVSESEDNAVLVAWDAVSELTDKQLAGLGLPGRAPVSVSLRCKGALTDKDFQVPYQYVDTNGFPLAGVRRTGCLLEIGGREGILPDPLYAVVEGLDDLNAAQESDRTERMLAWGRIADMLPEEVGVDDYLRTFTIRVIDAFEIRPTRNEQGEPDFDPVPGVYKTEADETGELRTKFVSDLPPGRSEAFAQRFRALRNVKTQQALGGNTYVVLSTGVRQALAVAREIQSGPPAQRTDFLRRPAAYIRKGLEEAGLDTDVDDVFWDEGLSERVRGIGVWEPKVLPWLQRSGESWLPPEKAGLLVDSERIEIEKADAPELLEKLKAAQSKGEPTVEYEGQQLPATDSTIEAVEELIQETLSGPNDGATSQREKTVLLVEENLEQVAYKARGEARPGGSESLPRILKSTLLPHQVSGLEWLQKHWTEGACGALLADDMGLGKSLQALAFLAWIREASPRPDGPLLIVAPTGLLKNWQQEHAKHLHEPGLGQPLEAFGASLKQYRRSGGNELLVGAPVLDEHVFRQADWVLTTYETLRDYQHSLARVRWAAAVFDEAQKIKNPSAGVTDAVLAMNIGFCIMMTGTPVENRPADIWSLLDRAQPGVFGSLKEFSREYDADSSGASLAQLNTRLQSADKGGAPVMLRRMKEDHLEGLPEKSAQVHPVTMPEPQAQAYREVIEGAKSGRKMLEALQAMRAVSLHPQAECEGEIEEYIAASARLAETFRILEEIRQRGEKALIFCEALEMQDFLAEALPRKFRLPAHVGIINGNVSGKRRQEIVDRFQGGDGRGRPGFDVLVLSPRAGGVGLTLTAANHVIHLSRWWNPAVEDQCSDRVYRIGQQKPVTIHIPIARHPEYGDHSFDVRLNELLERKRLQNRAVLAPLATSKGDLAELYQSAITL